MKRLAVGLVVFAGVGGVAALSLLRGPQTKELPVYEAPVSFFAEERQGLTLASLPQGVSSLSAEACAGCHQKEHAEWKGSAHARSTTEPVFAAAFKAEKRTLCRSCHSPLLEQHPQLVHRPTKPATILINGKSMRPGAVHQSAQAAIVEANPAYDAKLATEGVTCVTCHVRDGTVLTSNPISRNNVPHALSYSPQLKSAEFCGGCHQFSVKQPMIHPIEQPLPGSVRSAALIPPPPQVQNLDSEEPPVPPSPGLESQYQMEPRVQHTLDEFRISPAAARGESCQSCHMKPEKGRSTHNWPGDSSDEMLKKAVTLTARLDRPRYRAGDVIQAVITLRNDAGHRFPTGDSVHAGILDIWLRGGEKTRGRRVWLMSDQGSVNVAQNFEEFSSFRQLGTAEDENGDLEAPRTGDTRLLPGVDQTLIYRRRVTPEMAKDPNLTLRIRVLHAAIHPGFQGSRIDPALAPQRLVREVTLPVHVQK